ncbi:MAG: response regulator [Chloroflexi bacterium]|nr:response regulator [Chloroflexota bacterium]MCC6895507.1 response regulator [Anaerolineae bacterium]
MQLLLDKWTVLIVDDHYDNVMIAQTMLEYHGATVRIANDGEGGLALLRETVPTIILLDLSMPVMNGWDMLKQIRKMPQLAHVPVIAVTAHAMDGDKAKVLDAGFDEYVSKPYNVEQLISTMETTLQHKQTGR